MSSISISNLSVCSFLGFQVLFFGNFEIHLLFLHFSILINIFYVYLFASEPNLIWKERKIIISLGEIKFSLGEIRLKFGKITCSSKILQSIYLFFFSLELWVSVLSLDWVGYKILSHLHHKILREQKEIVRERKRELCDLLKFVDFCRNHASWNYQACSG